MATRSSSALIRSAAGGELRVAFDARMGLGHYRGMGRYLRTLIAGREQNMVGFCATGEQDEDLCLIAHGMRNHLLWEQVSLPRLLRENGVDVFVAPYNTAPLRLPRETRLILIVHDLIFMEPLPLSRSLYQNAGRLYRRLVTPHAIHRAETIVTVSAYTARQLVSRFGVDERRLRIIPVSIGDEWFAVPCAPRERATTVLTVAGEAPSKNLHRALEAFSLCLRKLGASGIRMKVAGVKGAFHGAFQKYAESLGIGDAVEFLPYVRDAEMRALYCAADVLLMPSLAEGFGIPVLEAMAAGLPVASSSTTSLPEVCGDAALFFDPLRVEEMAEALQRILSDGALRKALADRGRVRARRFGADAIAPKIQAFWTELASPRNPLTPTEFVPC
jgi:glycosyltransferase involved in cell wall biosynthesis